MAMHLADGKEDPKQHTPPISLVLAYLPMLLLAAGAASTWLITTETGLIMRLCITWSGALLCFLAGVRRGLSFRQEDGPTLAQLATMFCLFTLGVASLLSPWTIPALLLQLLGFAALAILDPIAARRGEAPRYFQRLRPAQMVIPVLSLLLLLARVTMS